MTYFFVCLRDLKSLYSIAKHPQLVHQGCVHVEADEQDHLSCPSLSVWVKNGGIEGRVSLPDVVVLSRRRLWADGFSKGKKGSENDVITPSD